MQKTTSKLIILSMCVFASIIVLLIILLLTFVNDRKVSQIQSDVYSFIIFGDSGVSSKAQVRIANLIDKVPSISAYIHTGDLIYDIGSAADYKLKFENIYSENIKNNFLPSLGNHDYGTELGKPYLDRFELPLQTLNPKDSERYYYKDFGVVRIISLDTNNPLDEISALRNDDMGDWLIDVLDNSTNKKVFIFFHHPPFSGNTRHASDERVRTKLIPIFDKYSNIKLVMNGHNHNFHLTCKLAFSKESGQKCLSKNDQGIYYMTTGGGGAPLYLFEDELPSYTLNRMTIYHYVKLDIDSTDICINVISEFGNNVYRYCIQ